MTHDSIISQTRIPTVVQQALDDQVFTAAALYVIYQGETRADTAWGQVDVDSPATPDTRFDLASVTKLYTSTALLRQISAGKAALETPLVDLLPEFGSISPRPVDGGQDPFDRVPLPADPALASATVDPAGVTLYHLLTHTSGLPPWRSVFAVAEAPTPPQTPDPIGRAERWTRALARLCRYPFVSPPGGVVRYSDVGLMLLGEAVARLHGTPGQLDAALRSLVLDPLEVQYTRFNPISEGGLPLSSIAPTELDPRWRKRRVWGEVHDENACGVGGVAGHAGLFATAHDVAALGEAWLHTPERLGLDPLLAADAVTMQANTDDNPRGLGWMLRSHIGSSAGDKMSLRSYGHTGFTGTSLWVDPEREVVVALLTNRVYPGREKPGVHAFRRAVHDAVMEALA